MTFKPILIELAEGAGRILIRHFRTTHRIRQKPRAGIVTEVDEAAEGYLLKKIFRKFPESSIITEESGEFHRGRPLLWILDPLDGTTNYAHGFPWFCVSIGVAEAGVLKAGVVYNPISKEMFVAEKGKGAWCNGERLKVSKTKKIADALIGTGFYYARGERLRKDMERFWRMNEVAQAVRRPGSAALDLACVARGCYDGFWERGLSCWDVAAGWVLVEEAGGRLSDFSGKDCGLFGAEFLASNGRLHQKLVNVLSKRK